MTQLPDDMKAITVKDFLVLFFFKFLHPQLYNLSINFSKPITMVEQNNTFLNIDLAVSLNWLLSMPKQKELSSKMF